MARVLLLRMPSTSRHALLLLFLASHTQPTTAINVEGAKGQHVHGEVDPDEYLWSKLPGRCCFELKEDCPYENAKKSQCKRRPPNSCRECSVWSTPENYCHGSHENCDSCGMQLYCPAPPPMVDGNKVCTGASRVGYGCNDEMATGMCAMQTEGDCEEACRGHPSCELFVYYPVEMKGTCVLCSDLISYERTIDAESRAYTVGQSHMPPMPPGNKAPVHFTLVPEPSPPMHKPPAPTYPPPKASTLGRHKADKSHAHVDCTFLDGVEFTTQRQIGYTDRIAGTKEECCNMCGHLETGCANFVYEPSSGVCVLLPLTPLNELEKDDNEVVISGTASVGAVALGAAAYNVESCAFIPDSGYSSGSLGLAPRLPGGEMQTREECCQVCGVTPGCTRFTFSAGNKVCMMYAASAELVMMNGDQQLTSGSIPSRLAGAFVPGTKDAAQQNTEGLLNLPPAPAMPEFAKLQELPPPPPPDLLIHGDSTTLQDFISDVSIVIFTLIFLGVVMCVYCFFAPQILTALFNATGGRMGKVHVRSLRHRHHKLPTDDRFDDAASSVSTAIMPTDEYASRKKKNRREKKALIHNKKPRSVRLVVQTTSVTQSKDTEVAYCESLDELRTAFYAAFDVLLKDVRPAQTQLFCLAPQPQPAGAESPPAEQEPLAWLLVSSSSDFSRVMECPAFRLQDKRCDDAGTASQYVVAFLGSGDSSSPTKPKKPRSVIGVDGPTQPSEVVPIGERRGRSRDRRGSGRGSTSAPASCVGVPDGEASDSDDNATGSRPPQPPTTTLQQAQLTAQALAMATGGDLMMPPVHGRAASHAGSAWDADGDPDGTGVSRGERVRAMADLE